MNEILEFTGDEWFRVKGRGFAIPINEKLPEGIWNPDDLVGRIVRINGETFTVKGVEKFMIAVSPQFPYRLKFSLLVRDLS